VKPKSLDRIGAVGVFVTAAGCPICFPLFAVVGSTLGLGFLRPYEGILMFAFQFFVLLSLIGNMIYYRINKKILPLVIGISSTVLIFFSFHIYFRHTLIYAGMFGLMAAAILNYLGKRNCEKCRV